MSAKDLSASPPGNSRGAQLPRCRRHFSRAGPGRVLRRHRAAPDPAVASHGLECGLPADERREPSDQRVVGRDVPRGDLRVHDRRSRAAVARCASSARTLVDARHDRGGARRFRARSTSSRASSTTTSSASTTSTRRCRASTWLWCGPRVSSPSARSFSRSGRCSGAVPCPPPMRRRTRCAPRDAETT